VAQRALNESALEAGLIAVETASTWGPRVVAKLETLIRSGDDLTQFRVNPIRFASDHSVDEEEAISLFLQATKAGLFDMEWNTLCASCGNVFGRPREPRCRNHV
jgi:hypothetical protein